MPFNLLYKYLLSQIFFLFCHIKLSISFQRFFCHRFIKFLVPLIMFLLLFFRWCCCYSCWCFYLLLFFFHLRIISFLSMLIGILSKKLYVLFTRCATNLFHSSKKMKWRDKKKDYEK